MAETHKVDGGAAGTLAPLQGRGLLVAGLLLALSNFIVVLDTTIANVSVSNIAGGLAISPDEGTYVITSYAVAEAIIVPLTAWLASRFGTLRVFTTAMLLFGVFSGLCGFATSLPMLIVGRVLQGLSGGPLIPLSQTLLMQIFPKEKRGAAMGLWAMTTLLAPVMGPIVGGYICDNWGWPPIFFINIPVAITCSLLSRRLLARFETAIVKAKVDFVGMLLLIAWVSALQMMLDQGKSLDWFNSPIIWGLLITAIVGFAAFMIWEFTCENPIVNMRVFRHRGYTASVITISLAFGSYFSSVVLTPLWLQIDMGYTATWSGLTTAATGVLAIISAPFAGRIAQKVDPRILVCCGVSWMGLMTLIRSFGTTDMEYGQIALPLLIQGIGMPFFFVPLNGLALSSVEPQETAAAAGLMSFLRTLSGAFATSIVTTVWDDKTALFHSALSERIATPQQVAAMLGNNSPAGQNLALYVLEQLTQDQAAMLALNAVFFTVSGLFLFAAAAIWLAPKPTRKADTSAAH